MTDLAHIEAARQRLRDRGQARAQRHKALGGRAGADARAIIDMIVSQFEPSRVYQWGSLLRPGGFRDYSDIDIAVEGITGAQTFFQILGAAQAMTEFDLDLVQIEKVAPENAEDIREHGRLVYERR